MDNRLKNNIIDVAKVYLDLTGRPYATLTIEEYMKIYNEVISNDKSLSAIEYTSNFANNKEIFLENKEEVIKEKEQIDKPITKTPIKNDTTNKQNTINALQMLKSVKG